MYKVTSLEKQVLQAKKARNIKHVKDLMGQIVGVGHVTQDEDVILIILNALFDSYVNFVQGV